MTSYCPSHHDSRSFNHALDDDFPSAVILNGGKNALWENRETERWNGVKNLLLEWHLTAFLTTIIDPSLPLRITSYRPSHHGNRSFNHALDDALSSAVILNGGKNTLWERRETGRWHSVMNLFLWWRLATNSSSSGSCFPDSVSPPIAYSKRLPTDR